MAQHYCPCDLCARAREYLRERATARYRDGLGRLPPMKVKELLNNEMNPLCEKCGCETSIQDRCRFGFSYYCAKCYNEIFLPLILEQEKKADSLKSNLSTFVVKVLDLRSRMFNDCRYGPFKLVCSTKYAEVLKQRYDEACGEFTLKDRLMRIDGVTDVILDDHVEDMELISEH